MENNNQEKFKNSKDDIKKEVEEAIEKLEESLRGVKDKVGLSSRGFDDKAAQFKERAEAIGTKTKEMARNVKQKYEETDPAKQKMIIAAFSALLASLLTMMAFMKAGDWNCKDKHR